MDAPLRGVGHPVVPFDHERPHTTEVFDPGVEIGQTCRLRCAETVLFVERDGGMPARRRFHNVGRRIALDHLKPLFLGPSENNFVLHPGQRGAAGLRTVTKRGGLGVHQHPCDLVGFDGNALGLARFAGRIRVVHLHGTGNIPPEAREQWNDVIGRHPDLGGEGVERGALRKELGEIVTTPPGPTAVADEFERNRLRQHGAAESEHRNGVWVGDKVE